MKDQQPYLISQKTIIEEVRRYNPDYGDYRICKCGHLYYRHFDTYENMDPCGCKYCQCDTFQEQEKPLENNFFCHNQGKDENQKIICLAYLAEGRVFDCPHKTINEAKQAGYKCDFKEIIVSREKQEKIRDVVLRTSVSSNPNDYIKAIDTLRKILDDEI